MNHKERIEAVLAGETPDHLPCSVWGHDFLREWSAEDLAAQTIERYRNHGYDFIKINPRWTMFAEPWGNQYEPPVEQKFPRLKSAIVNSPEDLRTIPQASASHPVFAEHVAAVRQITGEIGDEVDSIATLFSPLAVLGLLCGGVGEPLLTYLKEESDACHAALAHITETLTEHARDLLQAGASGVFFAPLQWTSLEVCSAELYAEYGEAYDRRLLAAVPAAFNMLHVCGNRIGMERFYDYPVPVLNWDNFGEGNPSLQEVREGSGKIVAGGVPHRKLHRLDADTLAEHAEVALGGLRQGVMFAGGCGIGALTPDPCRDAVVSVADRLKGS